MAHFRKRDVSTVEAVQFMGDKLSEVPLWLLFGCVSKTDNGQWLCNVTIIGKEKSIVLTEGYWIINHGEGFIDALPDAEFLELYEQLLEDMKK